MEQNCFYLQCSNDLNVISGVASFFRDSDFHNLYTSTLYIKSVLLGNTTWYTRKSDNWKEEIIYISDPHLKLREYPTAKKIFKLYMISRASL